MIRQFQISELIMRNDLQIRNQILRTLIITNAEEFLK